MNFVHLTVMQAVLLDVVVLIIDLAIFARMVTPRVMR